MKLIVTRPLDQAVAWVTRLQALGVQAQALPLIHIESLADGTALRALWAQLSDYTLVFFVSANAVQAFFAAAPEAAGGAAGDPPEAAPAVTAGGVDALSTWPAGVAAASPGPGTSAALRAAGVPDAQIAEPDPRLGHFDSEGLWEQLKSRSWAGCRVLVVRGEEGRDWLADTLRARGAEVDFIAAYRRCAPRLGAADRALLDDALDAPDRHVWHLSSSEAVGHLDALARHRRPVADWSHSVAVASHPRIVQAARDAGFGSVSQIAADVQAVADWWADLASRTVESGLRP